MGYIQIKCESIDSISYISYDKKIHVTATISDPEFDEHDLVEEVGASDLLDNIPMDEIVNYVDKDDFMKTLSNDDLKNILMNHYNAADYIEAYFKNFFHSDLLEHVEDEDILTMAREIKINEIIH